MDGGDPSMVEAVFFLESHNWHLDSALSSYYEQQDQSPVSSPHRFVSPPPPAVDSSSADLTRLPAVPTMSSSSRRPDDLDNKRKGSKANKGNKPSSGRIRTLSDLGRGSGSGSSDENDPDAPQEYYTGGEKRCCSTMRRDVGFMFCVLVHGISSLCCGMLVQGPTKGNTDVDSIFEQARQLGALEGPAVQVEQPSGSRSFTGTGRLLSGETVQAPQSTQTPQNIVHDLVFWSNGFTVNDGPLRRLDDPENASFLESIRKSECPEELEPADRKTSVHINLIRRSEDYPVQVEEKRHVPFQGVGRTLGSSSSSSIIPEPSVPLTATPLPTEGLTVDSSLPSTSIQLRLSDGTRLVARFNHHHTVAHVRAFIDAARPGSSRSYQLQVMGFTPKLLADPTQTIEQAGLANSVIVQKP